MPFNVLLLPLLGGYVFLTHWNRTRFTTKRYSGERLIFHAAIAGVVLLAIAWAITGFVRWHWPALEAQWRQVVPFAYTGTSLLAFILGCIGAPLLNWRFPVLDESRRIVQEWGDFLEVLLLEAMYDRKQISVTLTSGKVYIGFPTRNFDPAYDRKYVNIFPMLSGYRDAATKELIVTNNYAAVYGDIIEAKNSAAIGLADEFQVVLPLAEVQSVNLFDPEAYKRFNPPAPAGAGY